MAEPFWRQRLVPATFRGAEFKVEIHGLSGGRRNVPHEFPKRDTPYTEDMGRRARRYQVTGYVIGLDYTFFRDQLRAALEQEGSGLLIFPTGIEDLVEVDQFSVREQRRAGGMAEFDMTFIEAGEGGFDVFADTAGLVASAALSLGGLSVVSLNLSLSLS